MIKFTQFLRPNGRREEVTIAREEHIEKYAESLAAVGCRFECEELMTGMVSLTVEHDSLEDIALAHEICQNGPGVPAAVDRLFISAIKKLPEIKI